MMARNFPILRVSLLVTCLALGLQNCKTTTPSESKSAAASSPSKPVRSVTCPEGYVEVPGSTKFQTQSFCVMQFEAQNPLGAVDTWSNGGYLYQRYDSQSQSITAISDLFMSQKPVSRPGGTPWSRILKDEAQAACERDGASLPSLNQISTINANIIEVAKNWQSGVVGKDCLYIGHADIDPNQVLAVPSQLDQDYFGTNDSATSRGGLPICGSAGHQYQANASGLFDGVKNAKASRRTYLLSNGAVVWDWSGNAWEWAQPLCNDRSAGTANTWPNQRGQANGGGIAQQTFYPQFFYENTYTSYMKNPTPWQGHWFYVDWHDPSLSPWVTYISFFGPPKKWGLSQHMGGMWECDLASSLYTGDHTEVANGILRGGAYYTAQYTGPFTWQMGHDKDLELIPQQRLAQVGFRCVKPPVAN